MGNFLDKVAFKKLISGELTPGPISRLFLLLSNHVLIFLLVFLLKDKLHIPFIIFIVLGFTRAAVLIGFLGISYFIYLHYWAGVTIISLHLLFITLSTWSGYRYAKRNLSNQSTNISPFERTDLATFHLVQLLSFGYALYSNGIPSAITWIIYSLVTFLILSKALVRLKSKWCYLYYPLAIRYAHFLGREVRINERENKTPSIENVLNELLRSVYPNLNETETIDFIQNIKVKLHHFTDRNDLIAYCKQFSKNTDEALYVRTFDDMQIYLQKDEERHLPFFFFAEMIERDFGKKERLKFMMEFFRGNVK